MLAGNALVAMQNDFRLGPPRTLLPTVARDLRRFDYTVDDRVAPDQPQEALQATQCPRSSASSGAEELAHSHSRPVWANSSARVLPWDGGEGFLLCHCFVLNVAQAPELRAPRILGSKVSIRGSSTPPQVIWSSGRMGMALQGPRPQIHGQLC